MKRHLSLQPFSREHHTALILAQVLKMDSPAYKGMPVDVPGKAAYANTFYRNELTDHFNKEELVFENVKGADDELDTMMLDIIQEHQQLHQLFAGINANSNLVSHLDKLGHALEKHIRKEERILFPLMEQKLSPEKLISIGQFL